ncbi:hypothetical protein BG011_006280 [Mortierella polycephala]|uniref:Uncharacterized protein n=1 Tax=Mortierella polycephala TaxID=41804 RepID=A0A9P6QB62_9FUNG|nr:hypothetical protein BG011_006280 [Mortierella polycephala]
MESDEDRSPFQNSSHSSSDMISSVSVNSATFSPSFSDSDNMEQGRPRVTAGHPFVQSSEETTQSDLSSSGSENASSIYNSDDDGDRNDACSKKEVHHRDDDSVRNQSINDPKDWADHFLSIQSAYRNRLASLHHELCKDLHQRLEQHQRQILDLQRDMTCGLNELSPRAAATVHHSIDSRMDQDRKVQRKYCWLMERAIMTSLEGSMFNAGFTEDTVDGMRHCEDVEDDTVANRKSSIATQAVLNEKWELFARNEPERPHATILDLHNAQRQEKHIGLSFLNDGTGNRHSSDVKEKRDERASSGSDSAVDSCMREEIMKRVAELDAEAINNADRNEEEKADRPQEGRRRSACPSRQHNSSTVSASRPTSPVSFGLQSRSPPSSRWFFHRNSLDIPVSSSRTTPCRRAVTTTKGDGAHKPRPVTRPTRSQTAVFTPAKSAAKTLPSAVYDSGATVINNYFRGGVHYHHQSGHRPTPSRIRLRKTYHDSCIQDNVQKEIKLLDEDEEAGTEYEAGSDSDSKPYTEPNKKATLSKSRGDTDSGTGVGNKDADLSYSWGIGDPNSRERTSLGNSMAPQQQHILPFRLKEEQAGSTIPIVDQSSWIRASHINETMLTLEGRFEEAEEVQETRKEFESSINPSGSEKKRVSGNPTGLMQKHLEGKFEFDQWVALHDIRSQNANRRTQEINKEDMKTVVTT